MNAPAVIPVFILIASAAIAMLVAFFTWQRWKTPDGAGYFLLVTAMAVYAWANAFSLAAGALPEKLLWARLSYLGLVNISPLWLLFALYFSQHATRLTRTRVAALWIIPLVTLALVFTNPWHGLIWPRIRLASSAIGPLLVFDYGLGFWLHTVYAYILLVVAAHWLVRTARLSSRMSRLQAVALAAGAILPCMVNPLYLARLSPWPWLTVTALAFLLAGVLCAAGFPGRRPFNIAPVARDALFNSLGDGVLVLDTHNRLVDLNPAARSWTGLTEAAFGRDIFTVLELNIPASRQDLVTEIQSLLAIGAGDRQRIFDLTITPLRDARGRLQGRVALLHDIRHERALLNTERARSRQMELLNTITRTALSTPDLDHMLQVLVNSLGELFDADNAFLTLWDDRQRRVTKTAAYGSLREVFQSVKHEPGELTVTESVLAAGHALVIGDTAHSPYLSQSLAAQIPAISMLALPLIVYDQKLGAIMISIKQPYQFAAKEIALGEQAAGVVAIAIAKAMLYDAESQRSAQLTALHTISQMVVSSLDLDKIFATVVNVLHTTFKYPYVSIYRLHGDILRLGAEIGYPEELVYHEIPITRGVIGRTIRTREPQFLRDIKTDPAFLLAAYEVQSEICVPLLQNQTVLGALNVESAPPNVLTEADLQLLTAFGGQTAIAIENARIFSEMQRRAERERMLFNATRDFTAGLDTEAVLQAIANHMVHGLGVDACTVSRWDRDQDCVVTLFDYSAVPEHLTDQPGTTYALADYPVTREVLEKREPRFLYIGNPALDPAERLLMEMYGNRAALLLPLIVGRERQVFGLVELFRRDEAVIFTKGDLELAESFAAQAAVAIENARLYTEKQRLAIIDELTGLYNRRGLFELGQREFERATRFKHSLGALFLDIDHFKIFNDRYSYAVGDQVLALVASCVRANLRNFDLVGRFGGEEFVVLLPEADLVSAREVAERVRQSVENLVVKTELGDTSITVSIGVYLKMPDTSDLEALIGRAGQALHEAKNQGRNRVVAVEFPFNGR